MGKEDVSKKTVLVLLVITIVVSVAGTWTVLNNAVHGPVIVSPDSPGEASGQVSLSIAGDEPAPEPVATTGNIGLEIS